jgi:WD40 repeat protein
MNQKKFLEQYTYAIQDDFISPTGEPASWAPGYPKHWGQERAKILLDGKPSSLALSSDEKLIAVGIKEDIHVFDVATQERLEVLRGHTEKVCEIRFSPGLVKNNNSNDYDDKNQNDTRYMLVSGSDFPKGLVIIWELDEHGQPVREGREKKTVTADTLADKILQPLVFELTADYGWGPAEKAIEVLDQEVRNALGNAIKLHEQEDKTYFEGRLASFGSPTFSPDGKTMIYLSNNETTQQGTREAASLPCVNLWDVGSRSLQHQLLGHTDSIMWAAMGPDNLLVISIAWDGTARIWDARSGACLHVLGPFGGQLWSGAFSPCGKYLAISQGSPETIIHVYEIGTEQLVSRFEGFRSWARSLAWSPDGTMLVGAGSGAQLFIWDPYTGEERMRWRLAFEDNMMRDFASLSGVQFVDGGRKLMFQISDGTVEIYDFQSNLKKQFTRRAEDKIEEIPRSEMVCSGNLGLLVIPDGDNVLRLWDV